MKWCVQSTNLVHRNVGYMSENKETYSTGKNGYTADFCSRNFVVYATSLVWVTHICLTTFLTMI